MSEQSPITYEIKDNMLHINFVSGTSKYSTCIDETKCYMRYGMSIDEFVYMLKAHIANATYKIYTDQSRSEIKLISNSTYVEKSVKIVLLIVDEIALRDIKIKELEETNASQNIKIKELEETNALQNMHSVPNHTTVIVIGSESSGKSSLLENITKCPVFPRNAKICTKQPIHLKLRPSKTDEDKNYSYEYDGVTYVTTKNKIVKEIDAIMNTIDENTIINKVITINICDEKLPHFEFIDLPGPKNY